MKFKHFRDEISIDFIEDIRWQGKPTLELLKYTSNAKLLSDETLIEVTLV